MPKLTTLDVSKNTALEDLYCRSNQLSVAALDALFETLHNNTIVGVKRIAIGNNPGTADCSHSIATGKGWEVYDNWVL